MSTHTVPMFEISEVYNDPSLTMEDVYRKVRAILIEDGWEIDY